MLGRTLWAVGMLIVVASLLPGGATYIVAPTCHFAPCTLVNPLAAAVRHGCASLQLPARTVQALRPHSRTRHCALRALSTPPAAEFSSSERSLRELNRMLDMNEAELDVREATGTEGDSVAQLRCEVFGQGKEMYRSQCQKMRTSPHYLLAGIYKTTLMVAVVRALTPKARQVCKDVVLADMQELVDSTWISTWEHAEVVEQLEHDWETRSELVVGSVDCSVHEMLDSSLMLRRWVYLSSMAVRSHVRQRGVGQQLLVLAVAHARQIFGVNHMFLHVEELNLGALRLYKRAGFVRGDMHDANMKSMDRMLRLGLQVPAAATLYTRHLSLQATHDRKTRQQAQSQAIKMHHIAQTLAAQQVARYSIPAVSPLSKEIKISPSASARAARGAGVPFTTWLPLPRGQEAPRPTVEAGRDHLKYDSITSVPQDSSPQETVPHSSSPQDLEPDTKAVTSSIPT